MRRTSDVICCILTSKHINTSKICSIDRRAGYILDMYIKTTWLCVLISYFGSVYLQEFFFEGWTACRIFFFAIFLCRNFFWELSPVRSNGPPLNVLYIETTSWLVSAYDFYSPVVRIRKRTSERSERVSLANLHNEWIKIVQANQPWSNLLII